MPDPVQPAPAQPRTRRVQVKLFDAAGVLFAEHTVPDATNIPPWFSVNVEGPANVFGQHFEDDDGPELLERRFVKNFVVEQDGQLVAYFVEEGHKLEWGTA